MLSAMSGAKDDSADAHDLDKVYANTVMYSMLNSMVSSATGQSNNLPEFKKYLENPDNKIHDYISGIQYTYDMASPSIPRTPTAPSSRPTRPSCCKTS